MEQHDAFGVTQQGEFTAEDLSDVAVRLMAKDVYIARLQRRIQELTPQPEHDQGGLPPDGADARGDPALTSLTSQAEAGRLLASENGTASAPQEARA